MLHLQSQVSNANRESESLSSLRIVLTEPVDVYARWIDELEKANANPDYEEEEHEESEEENNQDSDGYYACLLRNRE